MNLEEYKQLKELLDSYPYSLSIKKLMRILSFFLYTKKKEYINDFIATDEDLETYLIRNRLYSKQQFFNIFKQEFINNGYFFHITNAKNTELILNQGILSLNDSFKRDVYTDCVELNQCWRNIKSKNADKMMASKLIEIPSKTRIYKKRFTSTYLATYIDLDLLRYYQDGMELFRDFIDHLCIGGLSPSCCKTKEEGVSYLTKKLLEKYTISDKELEMILSFYRHYYQKSNPKNNSTIFMVPKKSISDLKMNSKKYQELLKTSPEHFYYRLDYCYDLEYQESIPNDGLIALTLDNSSPIDKIKVKRVGECK